MKPTVSRASEASRGIIVSVDAIVFGLEAGVLRVLLAKRTHAPYEGMWAIPGGFVEPDESLDRAAARILEWKAGLKNVYVEQLYTFGDPGRDPRGRVITAAYIALVRPPVPTLGPDALWTPVDSLPKLAFDHRKILDYALQRLRYKLEYTPVGFRLLPEEMTLTQVQDAYEAILGRQLDKRNFRKKLLSLKVLKPLPKFARVGPHRPAQLYKFEPTRWEALKEKGNVFVF